MNICFCNKYKPSHSIHCYHFYVLVRLSTDITFPIQTCPLPTPQETHIMYNHPPHITKHTSHVLHAVLKYVPSWNMFLIGIVCRSEKCTILKKKMLLIGTVQTSSYWPCIILARSWSTKTCAWRPKVRQSYCICLFTFVYFSNECRATSNAMSLKDILLSAIDMTTFAQRQSEAWFQNGTFKKKITAHNANLKHVSGWHMFQNSM